MKILHRITKKRFNHATTSIFYNTSLIPSLVQSPLSIKFHYLKFKITQYVHMTSMVPPTFFPFISIISKFFTDIQYSLDSYVTYVMCRKLSVTWLIIVVLDLGFANFAIKIKPYDKAVAMMNERGR